MLKFITLLLLVSPQVIAGNIKNSAAVNIVQQIGSDSSSTANTNINNTLFSGLYSLSYVGPNTNAKIGYSLTHEIDNSNNSEKTYGELDLDLNSKFTHTPRWQTNFNSNIDQRNKSTTGRLLEENDVQSHFSTHTLGSVYKNSIKDFANYLLSGNIKSFGFSDDNQSDIINISNSFNSIRSNNSISWNTVWESTSSNDFDDRIDSLSAKAFYQINNHFKSFINTQSYNTQDSDISSTRYGIGLNWKISDRSSVIADIGQFENDDSWGLNANLKTKRTTYQLSHTETVTNTIFEFANNEVELGENTFIDTNLTNVSFFQKRDSISIQHSMNYLQSKLNYFKSSRFNNLSDASFQTIDGLILNLKYQLHKNSSLTLNLSNNNNLGASKSSEKSILIGWAASNIQRLNLGKGSTLSINFTESDLISSEKNTIQKLNMRWSIRPDKNTTISAEFNKSIQDSDVLINIYQQDIITLTYQHNF